MKCLWSFAAANDPCDKVRANGTALNTAHININYALIGRSSKGKYPGVPVSPASVVGFVPWRNKGAPPLLSLIVFYPWCWKLYKRKALLFHHDAALRRLTSCTVVALHLAGFSIRSQCCTAGLELCRWQSRFSPTQCTVGDLGRDSLSIYLLHGPSTFSLKHRRVLNAVKSTE